MKTRGDLYSKEAAELLRVISDYKVLMTEQVLRLFPGREEKTKTIINTLRQQKRLWVSPNGKMVMATENAESSPATIKAFRVLSDFIDRVEYHCTGTYPVTLSFFLDAEFYEVIFVPVEQETLICHALSGKSEDMGKRIVIVEDAEQIERLNIPGVSGYCTVTDKGTIQYYQRKSESGYGQ